MEQTRQHPPDSRVWDDRATEIIAEARKMPLGITASCRGTTRQEPGMAFEAIIIRIAD
jgi:hypothetical protein